MSDNIYEEQEEAVEEATNDTTEKQDAKTKGEDPTMEVEDVPLPPAREHSYLPEASHPLHTSQSTRSSTTPFPNSRCESDGFLDLLDHESSSLL
jgi:hypothetical protein